MGIFLQLHTSRHRKRSRGWGIGLCLTILCLPAGNPAYSAPKIHIVAATPVSAAIAEAIAGDHAEVSALIRGATSPHHISLRPSQILALERADIILAVHPDYEIFLKKLDGKLPIIWLGKTDGLEYLPVRPLTGHEHEAHAGTRVDPHLWLEPRNVARMGEYLAARLANHIPQKAALWQAHATSLREDMQTLRIRMRSVLHPDKEKTFAAYHDGYHYFENATGITLGMTFSDATLHQLRPAALAEIKALVHKRHVSCLVSEPEFNPGIIERLGNTLDIPVTEIDPEGMMRKEKGVVFFERLLLGMARDFHECFWQAKKS